MLPVPPETFISILPSTSPKHPRLELSATRSIIISSGWVIIHSSELIGQPLASVTRTEYVPAPKLLISWLFWPVIGMPLSIDPSYHWYVYGCVPPSTSISIFPFWSLKHRRFINEVSSEIVIVISVGSSIANDRFLEQKLLSVTITSYVPATRLFIFGEFTLEKSMLLSSTSVPFQLYE